MSKELTKEQIRNEKVLAAIRSKGKTTISDLANYFKITPDQNFFGRKLKLIVADLVYSKQLKVIPGKNPIYFIGKASSQKVKISSSPVSFNLQEELDTAVKSSIKPKLSVLGPGKKISPIEKKESKIIPLTRPEPEIAPYPVIGNLTPKVAPKENINSLPSFQQQSSTEDAFKIFESAFEKNPNKTIDTLVKVVFEQQRKLDRQEKLLKALHKLLGDYLAG